jgi:3-phosphoshikimate 1-carboxyvinyltransferase
VILPQLIEIFPLSGPIEAQVTVPGSKSITNRALLLAALSSGTTILRGALWSEDTEVMVNCLKTLGVRVVVAEDLLESANRTLTVHGTDGIIAPGGPPERPLELFVGNAGTAARFIAALVCLGRGNYRLTGTARMHERPQAALFDALRQLGYSVESDDGRLPAVVRGSGPHPGATCRVRIDESSQFASALLLAGGQGAWNLIIEGASAEEVPYIHLTEEIIRVFPSAGGTFDVEPDASSASYFCGADWLLRRQATTRPSDIRVANFIEASFQVDARFPRMLRTYPATISRQHDLGDSIMTAIVLAPFADSPKTFVDLGRLRVQECERVQALHTELKKCGANIVEEGDTLRITPHALHGAEIETYDDHRMAMCFALVGLVVPGIRIRNPECVRKTFPNFFQKLSQLPPNGLGATVRGVLS